MSTVNQQPGDRISESNTDDNGTTSGMTVRDDGDSIHTTTWVDDGDNSIRVSYDEDKDTGEYSGAHFTKQ